MAQFILIDPSLVVAAGHHFEYALEILGAAAEAGYQPVLAMNESFSAGHEWPAHWRVLPIFRYGIYTRHQLSLEGKATRAVRLNGWLLPAPQLPPSPQLPSRKKHRWFPQPRYFFDFLSRRHRIQAFADSCTRLFKQIGLAAEDCVFFPTLTEFSLLGLIKYLTDHPSTRCNDWHVQFHFDVFSGKEPDYDRQAHRAELFRSQLAESLRHVPGHRLHFYATTDRLRDQYNRLNVAPFHTLPYPTNRGLQAHRRQTPTVPLRITCAGGLREEKGSDFLPQLITTLWPNYLRTGHAQLILQGQCPHLLARLPLEIRNRCKLVSGLNRSEKTPILFVPYPLAQNAYLDLVRQTDLALFLYDHRPYYARCSGVLVEMLTAGTPVLVPAGSWLSEQVAESDFQHLEKLQQSDSVIDRFVLQPLSPSLVRQLTDELPPDWHADMKTGTHWFDANLPADACDLIIKVAWTTRQAGCYLRLRTLQYDADSNLLSSFCSIVESRASGAATSSLVHLRKGVRRIRCTIDNAYHDEAINVRSLEITALRQPNRGGTHPAGKVGLIAATFQQTPELLNDMLEHYEHYRDTARGFSSAWTRKHDPARTVEILSSAVKP